MLKICPNIPGQKFVDPPFEEEILNFMRKLGYSGNIKSLSIVKVEMLPQPWRTIGTIINKCLSGKVTGLDLLRLSCAQILWGMFHQKNVDYVYLLWENLVFQIKNKVSKRNKDMYYPRFTKVIINHFMSQDQSIPRRNKVDWHMAKDDHESEAYKTYYDLATGKVAPKPKYVRRSTRTKTDQAPQDAPGKRLKATAKMKIAIERSKTQLRSSHASGSGADERTGVSPGVPDVPTDRYKDEHISWKSSDEDDDEEVSISKDDDEGRDDVNEQTESDNDGDDFVHPKFSTHDQEERQDEEDEEDKQEEGSDLRVQTSSHYESTDDEECDEETQGANVEGEEMDEEETNKEEETNVQGTKVTEDTHVIITAATLEVQQQSSSVSSGFISNMLNPNPDTGIDSILNLNTESTTLVDVPVTSNAEMPPSPAKTPPPPPIPPIQPLQQTPFEDRGKALEDDFSKFKQTNQFAAAVSSIPGIVDTYLANKMNEAVKTTVQLQSDRLRDEAQAENEDFINKLDDNIKKIIKEQVKSQVKEQTSHAIAANLSELELKKILIDKMESNKSIHRFNNQKTLYKALVDAYESDKLILDTYGDTVTIKRRRDDQDEDEEPSVGSNRGSKRRRAGKEPESTSGPKEKTSKSSGKSKEGSKSHNTYTGMSAQAEEPIHADKDLEEPAHQEFDTGFTEDQLVDETTQHHEWFQKLTKPPTPDRDWNKTLPAAHGPIQSWINNLAQKEDTHDSFNELMDTPLDFSTFVMNRLKINSLTLELLVGLTFENNPEGQQYPHDLHKPLPLIPNSQGRRVIPFDHFINNDLAYLRGGSSSRTYATLVTKTKAVDYGHVKWIEDLVLNTMWSPMPVIYDKHALWGISHWGRKRQQFYGFAVNKESTRDVYSRHKIISITNLLIVEWQNYKHLDWITVRRNDDKLSIVIQRRVEDLQLGVESYQKKLNLIKLDTYRSDLKRREAYTAYSNPRCFIYQNKDKKNRLMRIDELHKFSDGTLNDVRTALNDRLKGIRMKYLPQIIWRQSDRDKAGAMIQEIDKQLKNKRIMRSLEKFVGGRPYEGDF
ncbi:hypothetical protein Tco_0897016 [Tanacetum coccineum]